MVFIYTVRSTQTETYTSLVSDYVACQRDFEDYAQNVSPTGLWHPSKTDIQLWGNPGETPAPRQFRGSSRMLWVGSDIGYTSQAVVTVRKPNCWQC